MRIIYIKKKFILIFLIVIMMILLLGKFFLARTVETNVSYLPATNKTIGIDPGHGGVDPGAVGKGGALEDELNLEIALKLKRLIKQSGGLVVMTRETDKGLYTKSSKTLREKKSEDLKNRKKLIEESKCDLFITIHMNSFTDSRYYGAQTFYMVGSEEGEKLASMIQEEFRGILNNDNKRQPTGREDVYLLKEMTIPSVLVEAGFLSNSMEGEATSD